MLMKEYSEKILELIEQVENKQAESINEAAKMIASSIQKEGLLHLFGCGHSHILTEEVFYRAGGLVPVNPILETSTMLHEGAVKSSKIERMEGYAKHILDNYNVKSGEVLVIISNSGINGLPVEMAMEGKKKGLKIIAMTSSSYLNDPSRHSSGKKLAELADVVIDNMLPHGDALVQVPDHPMKTGPGSTVVGAFIINALMIQTVECLKELDVKPPIFLSGNVEGGMEYNQRYIDQYRDRIKHL
ncbi:MAG TPA: SIS domain-containing protein [Bacillales bacterium]